MKEAGESMARMRKAEYRANKILDAALELFCTKGLEETVIDEIAEKAQVGSATIYRYFETKAELAIRCAVNYWKWIGDHYFLTLDGAAYEKLSGAKQLDEILERVVRIFEEERKFLKFIQEFEVFVRSRGISTAQLKEYSDCIMKLKPKVTDALLKGLEDNTLQFSWTPDEVCYSMAHTMFSLMKKLAWNGSMLELDSHVDMVQQIRITKALLIEGLKKV